MNQRQSNKIYTPRCLVLFLLTVLASYTTLLAAQENDGATSLYLPYQSSQYPELALKLNAALSEAGLDQFRTKPADNWPQYQQGIRQGRIGVYLAAPHFTAWALHKHNFIPFLRLSNSLQYVVATRHNDSQFFEINDLVGESVCSQRALNLDFLLLQDAFQEPVKSVQNRYVNSVASAMQYDNQNCAAFAVSEHTFKRFNAAEPGRFIRLLQGPEFRNYAFIAHPEIAPEITAKLKRFLRGPEANKILSPLLKQFSSSDSLLPVRRTDYPVTYVSILISYWD